MLFHQVLFRHSKLNIQPHVIILAVVWIAGVLAGFYFADMHPFLLEFHSLSYGNTSLVVKLFILVLPLALSALSMKFLTPLLFIPLAFFDAFILAYSAYCVQFSFGGAGWLIRWLLLFSDSFIAVLLLLYWIRNIDGRYHGRKDFPLLLTVSCLVGCIDYYVISPFLATLLLH